jgi:hypothetical protein
MRQSINFTGGTNAVSILSDLQSSAFATWSAKYLALTTGNLGFLTSQPVNNTGFSHGEIVGYFGWASSCTLLWIMPIFVRTRQGEFEKIFSKGASIQFADICTYPVCTRIKFVHVRRAVLLNVVLHCLRKHGGSERS